MAHAGYELSIEEVAMAMSALGHEDAAGGYLVALLGEVEQVEVDGRLYAAAHSLMARGYLRVDVQTGEKWIDPALAEVVKAIGANDYSLRCSRAVEGEEEVLSFFVNGVKAVQHRVRDGVVARLEPLPDLGAVAAHCAGFFGLSAAAAGRPDQDYVAVLPASVIDSAFPEGEEGPEPGVLQGELQEIGLAPEVAKDLAADLAAPAYRGTVLRVAQADGQIDTDDGFLVLKGSAQLWLLAMMPGDKLVLKLFLGTPGQFAALLQPLMHTAC